MQHRILPIPCKPYTLNWLPERLIEADSVTAFGCRLSTATRAPTSDIFDSSNDQGRRRSATGKAGLGIPLGSRSQGGARDRKPRCPTSARIPLGIRTRVFRFHVRLCPRRPRE